MVLGLVCVWLTVRQNLWCWPTGLIQVALYMEIFREAKLYSDVILNGIFVVLQIYGWYHWLGGGDRKTELKVTRLTDIDLAAWMIIGFALTLAWGYVMQHFTDAAAPYPDAFILIMSLIAQWLMALKKLPSWYFWIAVDITAIGLYYYKQLYMTSCLYMAFLGLATLGYMEWKQSMRTGVSGVPVEG